MPTAAHAKQAVIVGNMPFGYVAIKIIEHGFNIGHLRGVLRAWLGSIGKAVVGVDDGQLWVLHLQNGNDVVKISLIAGTPKTAMHQYQ